MYNQLPFEEKSHVLLKSLSITCLLKEFSFPYISDVVLTSHNLLLCAASATLMVRPDVSSVKSFSAFSRISFFFAAGKYDHFSWYCSLGSRLHVGTRGGT